VVIEAAAARYGEQGTLVELEFDLPATYRIRVKGCLDAHWSDRLGGMEIRAIDQAEGAPETVLVGSLPDQAALCGILNALYDLHLPLRSVQWMDPEDERESQEAG
jgi:hypothetical protein